MEGSPSNGLYWSGVLGIRDRAGSVPESGIGGRSPCGLISPTNFVRRLLAGVRPVFWVTTSAYGSTLAPILTLVTVNNPTHGLSASIRACAVRLAALAESPAAAMAA